jgi:uncharacterized protein
MTIKVSNLICYPLKGAKGINRTNSLVWQEGLEFDRNYLVIDSNGMFVTQRSDGGLGIGIRAMALISPHFYDDTIVFEAPGMDRLVIPLLGYNTAQIKVQIWKDYVPAWVIGDKATKWFTEFLSEWRPGTYRLVRIASNALRMSSNKNGLVAFGDGYPLTVLSEGSLFDLNKRMSAPLPTDRFRPNIVLKGIEAYGEDTITRMRIVLQNALGVLLRQLIKKHWSKVKSHLPL